MALVQMQEILHLPNTVSPTSELSSKPRLPYIYITGYATTPYYVPSSAVSSFFSHDYGLRLQLLNAPGPQIFRNT